MGNDEYLSSPHISYSEKLDYLFKGHGKPPIGCGCFFLVLTIIIVVILVGIFIEGVIHIDYRPQKNVKPIPNAKTFTIFVEVNDLRQDKGKIVCKNYIIFGIRFGTIKSIEDVPEILKKAIETEILNRGFSISKHSNILINVSLNKFYNDIDKDLDTQYTVAELNMKIMVIDRARNNIIYTKQINGINMRKIEKGTLATSIEDIKLCTKISLENALKNAMRRLFADDAFIKSLKKQKIKKS